MNGSLKRFFKIALPVGLGLFLIWLSYIQFTPEQLREIGDHFSRARYGYVILAVVLSVISHIIRATRWNILLEPMGYRPGLANNFMAVSIAYLMNIFIPKSGEVSRAVVLDRYEGVPFEKGFGTIITERIIDLLFLAIFTLVALFWQFDELFDYLKGIIPIKKLLVALLLLLALGVILLLFVRYSQSRLGKRVRNFVLGLKEGVFSILRMKRTALFVIQTILIWLLYLLSFYTATLALEETAGIAFGTLLITFVVGSFSFAFTNSGFGSYPLFVAGILSIFGVASTVGTAFGWIVWSSNIVMLIFFGVISLVLLPVVNKTDKA